MPVVVDFLLSSCSKVDCYMAWWCRILGTAWSSLSICVHHRGLDQGVLRREKWRKTRVECIILNKISMTMSSDKWMGEAWVSTIESEEDGGESDQEQDQSWYLH